MSKERKKILEDLKRCANEGKGHLLLDFEIRHILAHINQLQQENQQLKKQKAAVFEYIKKYWYSKNTRDINEFGIGDWRIDILKMLGEIDETDNLQ